MKKLLLSLILIITMSLSAFAYEQEVDIDYNIHSDIKGSTFVNFDCDKYKKIKKSFFLVRKQEVIGNEILKSELKKIK